MKNDKVVELMTNVHAFSIYMGNLPLNVSKNWVREVFVFFGSILDVFLFRKLKKQSSPRFTFVRFFSMAKDGVAIQALNGEDVDGCCLAMAKIEMLLLSEVVEV